MRLKNKKNGDGANPPIYEGKREEFLKLYDRYAKKIYSFIFYRVASKADAEDLTSQVFIRMWEYSARNPDEKIKNQGAFIFRTAKNAIIDYYRARRRTVALETIENDINFSESMEPEFFDAESDRKILLEAIDALENLEKEVIILKYFSEFSAGEIAKITGKSVGNVYVIVFRALKKLKKIISEQ